MGVNSCAGVLAICNGGAGYGVYVGWSCTQPVHVVDNEGHHPVVRRIRWIAGIFWLDRQDGGCWFTHKIGVLAPV